MNIAPSLAIDEMELLKRAARKPLGYLRVSDVDEAACALDRKGLAVAYEDSSWSIGVIAIAITDAGRAAIRSAS